MQKDVWALFVALLGLTLVWVWKTGRADSVWSALVGASGSISPSANSVPNSATAPVNPVSPLPLQNQIAQIQITPYALQITQPSLNSFAPPNLGGTPAALSVCPQSLCGDKTKQVPNSVSS